MQEHDKKWKRHGMHEALFQQKERRKKGREEGMEMKTE